jgi:DNA-binding HxlR family transcriptional regulator
MSVKFSKEIKALINILQKRRRIEIIIHAYDIEDEWIGWGAISKVHGINDGTFRTTMRELEELGLAERKTSASGFHSQWRLTGAGCCIASLVKEKILDMEYLLTRPYMKSKGIECELSLQST